MKIRLLLALILFGVPTYGAVLTPQFEIIKKQKLQSTINHSNRVIHEMGDLYITASNLTDFDNHNYYAAMLPPNTELLRWLQDNAQVVDFYENKMVLLRINNEKELLKISSKIHHSGQRCGMLQILGPESVTLTKSEPPMVARKTLPEALESLKEVRQDKIVETIKTMSSWQTRFHSHQNGIETAEKLQSLYEKLTPSDRNDVEIELFTHKKTQQKSLIVRIQGSTHPDEIVILGSHIDSINNDDNNTAPGADDNASGTATNLEAFRVIMQSGFKPNRTIEIHGYAAEEVGLVGSKEISAHYKAQSYKVVSMVQMDMNGYAGSGDKVTFVSNGTNSSLTRQLMSLANDYLSIPVTQAYLLFGSSDHAAWAKHGYPVAFPTEDTFQFNRKIHSAQDTLDGINSPKQMTEFAKLSVVYLMHFAKL